MKASVKPHYEYARYIVQHGTKAEKANLRTTLSVMSEVLDCFPGGHWEPMTGIYLIDYLIDLADRIAKKRLAAAERQHYRDHQGKIGRSFDEERRTVRGHLAAQMMLSLPLGHPETKEQARAHGNIGQGNEAFIPLHNPIEHNLIVDPKTNDDIVSWLVVPEGDRRYRLDGWIEAREAKQPMYRKARDRAGGRSIAYWIPPALLHPVGDWWER